MTPVRMREAGHYEIVSVGDLPEKAMADGWFPQEGECVAALRQDDLIFFIRLGEEGADLEFHSGELEAAERDGLFDLRAGGELVLSLRPVPHDPVAQYVPPWWIRWLVRMPDNGRRDEVSLAELLADRT